MKGGDFYCELRINSTEKQMKVHYSHVTIKLKIWYYTFATNLHSFHFLWKQQLSCQCTCTILYALSSEPISCYHHEKCINNIMNRKDTLTHFKSGLMK